MLAAHSPAFRTSGRYEGTCLRYERSREPACGTFREVLRGSGPMTVGLHTDAMPERAGGKAQAVIEDLGMRADGGVMATGIVGPAIDRERRTTRATFPAESVYHPVSRETVTSSWRWPAHCAALEVRVARCYLLEAG